MRGLGYTCQLSAGTNDVVVINNPNDVRQWQALRTLTTTDSLMLYIENDKTTSGDDLWLTVGLTTAPVAQDCPDGTAGIRFRIGMPAGVLITSATAFGNMFVGGPVRAFELMQMRSYTSGGKTWLGMRSRPLTVGTPLEPVLGPLTRHGHRPPASPTATPATTPPRWRTTSGAIQVSLQSASDEVVRTTGQYAKLDSLTMTTRVALRNALRP